jgi:hypothetical protein
MNANCSTSYTQNITFTNRDTHCQLHNFIGQNCSSEADSRSASYKTVAFNTALSMLSFYQRKRPNFTIILKKIKNIQQNILISITLENGRDNAFK